MSEARSPGVAPPGITAVEPALLSNNSTDRFSLARRIQRNFAIVLGGSLAATAFGLITLALNARALGVTGLGIFALVTTTATLVSRVLCCYSWIPLIKFGSEALQTADRRRLGELITAALLFDSIAAVVAAGVGAAIVGLAGQHIGIPDEYRPFALIYMASLLTGTTGFAIGVLRLFNRFGTLAAAQAAGPALGCTTAISLFVLGAPLWLYVVAFAVVIASGNAVIVYCGARAAIAANLPLGRVEDWTLFRRVSRQFWSFSWAMNLSSIIQVLRQYVPVLLIGGVLGPAAVGLYHAAERIAAVLLMVMTPVSQAVYPEAARLAANRRYEELNWLSLRAGGFCSMAGVAGLAIAAILGPVAIPILFGSVYEQAIVILVLLMAAHCFAMAGVGYNSAVIATAGPRTLLKASVIAGICFGLALPTAVAHLAVAGVAASQILFDAVWFGILAGSFRRWLSAQARAAA